MQYRVLLFPELLDTLDKTWERWVEEIDRWLNTPWQQEESVLQPVRLREKTGYFYELGNSQVNHHDNTEA